MSSIVRELCSKLAENSALQEGTNLLGVYLIFCKANDKGYIGSTVFEKGFDHRWTNHINSLSRADHGNLHLQNAWCKYGEAAFEFIIVEVCTKTECVPREQYYIDLLWESDMLFNISRIAGGGGGPHSDATKKKMSDTRKVLHSTPEYRANMSVRMKVRYSDFDERRKTSAAMLEYWSDPEARNRQAARMTLRYSNPEERQKQSRIKSSEEINKQAASLSKHCENPAVREKMSIAAKKATASPEARERLSQQAKAFWARHKLLKSQTPST